MEATVRVPEPCCRRGKENTPRPPQSGCLRTATESVEGVRNWHSHTSRDGAVDASMGAFDYQGRTVLAAIPLPLFHESVLCRNSQIPGAARSTKESTLAWSHGRNLRACNRFLLDGTVPYLIRRNAQNSHFEALFVALSASITLRLRFPVATRGDILTTLATEHHVRSGAKVIRRRTSTTNSMPCWIGDSPARCRLETLRPHRPGSARATKRDGDSAPTATEANWPAGPGASGVDADAGAAPHY